MDCIGLVRDILADELAVPVATDMPKDRPTRMVMVDLEGDASDEFILRPRIAITC